MASNTSFATATEVSFTVLDTHRIDDIPEPVGTSLFYTFIAPTDGMAMSIEAYSTDLGVYVPSVSAWEGNVDVHARTNAWGSTSSNQQAPMFLPTTPGTRYFLEIRPSGGDTVVGATLQLRLQTAPTPNLPISSLLINDDTIYYPSGIVDSATGDLVGFIPYGVAPSGEFGDSTLDGLIALDDAETGELRLIQMSPTSLPLHWHSVAVPGLVTDGGPVRANATGTRFYLFPQAPANALTSVSTETGEIDQTWVNLSSPVAGTASLDDSVFYYRGSASSLIIKRHDLNTDTAMADFVTVAGYHIDALSGLFTLSDGRIVSPQAEIGAGSNDRVVIYNPDGSEDRIIEVGDEIHRVDVLERPTGAQMIVWIAGSASTGDTFTLYDLSSGAILRQVSGRFFRVSGRYMMRPDIQPDETPFQPFGHSESCHIILLPDPVLNDDPSHTCCECPCPPPRGSSTGGGSGSPTTSPPVSAPGDILPPVEPLSWVPFCVGGGDVPFQADPTDSELWVS